MRRQRLRRRGGQRRAQRLQHAGQSLLPDNTATNIVSGFPRNVNHAVDLNSFYGYPPAINRRRASAAQNMTDPSCIYDSGRPSASSSSCSRSRRDPTTGAFTHVNHLDIAVSQTANPTGAWNIYRLDVTNDGTQHRRRNPGPCLGDYPHIGADATASTSRPTTTHGAATASTAPRSTPSPRRARRRRRRA